MPRPELRERYVAGFMQVLALPATPARHANVMQHIAGHFEERPRRELRAVIAEYRAGRVPLAVPLTVVRDYVRRFDIASLKRQVYLEPQPMELLHNQRIIQLSKTSHDESTKISRAR